LEAQEWLDKFADAWRPFYHDWLPASVSHRDVLERTKLPYIPFFSFGEKLPVVNPGTSDPESLGYAYEAAGKLLASEFRGLDQLLGRSPAMPVPDIPSKQYSQQDEFTRLAATGLAELAARIRSAPEIQTSLNKDLQDEIGKWVNLIPGLQSDLTKNCWKLFDIALSELSRETPDLEFSRRIRSQVEALLSGQEAKLLLTRGQKTAPPTRNNPVILVHGYSDKGAAWAAWREILRRRLDLKNIDLRTCTYIFNNNEISINDVAEAFDRALLTQGGLEPDQPFDAMVHSTGMLVVRAWLASDPTRARRLKRLIALAPATFGSPLANRGRSWIGAVFKGSRQLGPDFLEAGDRVLSRLRPECLHLVSRFVRPEQE
jgi:pimeloyl-ACP methyl ester carboxylesterase